MQMRSQHGLNIIRNNTLYVMELSKKNNTFLWCITRAVIAGRVIKHIAMVRNEFL